MNVESCVTWKSNYEFVIFIWIILLQNIKTLLSPIHLMIDIVHLKIIFLINK